MATIDRFQEIKDSRKLSYGEDGAVTRSRSFLCPSTTVEKHRPKIGDDYGKAPAIEGGARISSRTDLLCISVDIESFGDTDTGTSGTVKITANYSAKHSPQTDEGGESIDNVAEIEFDTSVEFDTAVNVDRDGVKVFGKTTRQPKVVVRLTQRRETRMYIGDITSTIGCINAAKFLGGAPKTVLLNSLTIKREGLYWVHTFEFVYYYQKIPQAGGAADIVRNWDSVNGANKRYPIVDFDSLDIQDQIDDG